jgi:hypothetical protein
MIAVAKLSAKRRVHRSIRLEQHRTNQRAGLLIGGSLMGCFITVMAFSINFRGSNFIFFGITMKNQMGRVP